MKIFNFIFTVCLILGSAMAISAETASYSEENLSISVTPNQPQFTIRLKSNPTTGYSWSLRKYNSNLIAPIKHHFEVPKTKMIGAPGVEVWTFRVKPDGFTVPQQTRIQFEYARPWENGEHTTKVVFKVTTMTR